MARLDLFKTGVAQAAHMLELLHPQDSPQEIKTFIRELFNRTVTPPTFTGIVGTDKGNPAIQNLTPKEFVAHTKDTMVSPFGAIYASASTNESTVRAYLGKNIANRAHYKDLMYEYASVGNRTAEKQADRRQSRVKINNNSVIGAKGSEFNCFYDLAGFNAVTAAARTLIKNAYSVTEQTLEANFHWVDEDDLLNFINVHLFHMPPMKTIEFLINKYQLYQPTREELFTFYLKTMSLYSAGPSLEDKDAYQQLIVNMENITHVQVLKDTSFTKPLTSLVNLDLVWKVLSHLDQEQITYLFYVQNVAHLFFKNTDYFKQFIEEVMSVDNVEIIPGKYQPSDVSKFDEAYIPVLSLAYNEVLYGTKLGTVIKNNPEQGLIFANFLGRLEERIASIQGLLDAFILTPISITRVNEKDNYWRKTVVESDTDSVIFEIMNWIEWYCGNGFDDSPRAYQIIAFTVFLLSKVMDHHMRLYCRQLGAQNKEEEELMIMKNEYWYPFMIIYEIKKTYAGAILIKEGNVLKAPKLDIKGVNLKGSAFPGVVKQFVEDRVRMIKPGLSVRDLIAETCNIERGIFQELVTGSFTYLKTVPVRRLEEYDKDPNVTSYFYYRFWQEVFAPKYGDLPLPGKYHVIPLLPIKEPYLEQLANMDKELSVRLCTFLEKNKTPNFIIVNPLLPKLPEELIMLMDARKIINSIVRPFYITLRQFGVPVWFESKDFLLSDAYDDLS